MTSVEAVQYANGGHQAPDAVRLRFPFRGRWMALNSPANRVPSHGSHLFGTTYAIDFVAVDKGRQTAPRDWRSVVATEPPHRFFAFGQPILAPLAGTVVLIHDGEPDHEARRSLLTAIPYLLAQGGRARQGTAAIAGNHVVLSVDHQGPYVLLAHLRRGSVRVQVGDRVEIGDVLAECGNSGNSTQPHVHVQATDSIEWESARGIPISFVDGGGQNGAWLPRNAQPFEVRS